MKNLIHATRNRFRSAPRLLLLKAAVVAVVFGLLLGLATTPPASEAQGYTETVWSATMTVGTFTAEFQRQYGFGDLVSNSQLSLAAFTLRGQTYTVAHLVEDETVFRGTVTSRSVFFSTSKELPDDAILYLGETEFAIADSRYTTQGHRWEGIEHLDWSAGDTVQVRLDAELQPPRMDPYRKSRVVDRLTVAMDGDPDDGWASYEFADPGQTARGQWVFSLQFFVFSLQDDRLYLVEVDTDRHSKDPRIRQVTPRSNEFFFSHKSTRGRRQT